ncbi:MAG: SufD family Fe-S cluster assembly protein [Thermoplasmata archaeon]|nr:MAG: SufD family Fe-S cluster assembly protein [Thermoplasmata archaeon]
MDMKNVRNAGEKMEELEKVGFDRKMKREASFLAEDDFIKEIKKGKNVEIMPIEEALKEYDLPKFFGRKDRYTKMVLEKRQTGYFIRVPEGKHVTMPVQTAFLLKSDKFNQILHNIIVLEENSRLDMISGCTATAFNGLHASITQYHLKKGSYLTYTMIHNWGENVEVYPRSSAYLEEGSTFISNYIALTPAKKIESNPIAILEKEAIARFYSILYARKNSDFDVGAIARLNGRNAKAEIISRIIAQDAKVISRGLIEGNAIETKGHMECSGMVMGKGIIHTIPELKSSVANVELSHEAAIGKLAEEQLNYLMARGIDEEEAKSLLIRGFLDVNIKGLPPHLNKAIERAIDLMATASI